MDGEEGGKPVNIVNIYESPGGCSFGREWLFTVIVLDAD